MIEQEKIIEKTKNFIRKKFEGESSGHDWWHIYIGYGKILEL